MARTPQGIEHLDLESLSDEQLGALQTQVKEKLDERVRNRLDEYRRIARGAGYELTLTRIGEEVEAGAVVRVKLDAAGKIGAQRLLRNTAIRKTGLKPGRGGDANQSGCSTKSQPGNPERIF